MAGTRESICVVLSRPTFLDLLDISEKFGVDEIDLQNKKLLDAGAISDWRYRDNSARLAAIKKGLADEN